MFDPSAYKLALGVGLTGFISANGRSSLKAIWKKQVFICIFLFLFLFLNEDKCDMLEMSDLGH